METAEPFCVMDCSLIRRATGRACFDLRELRDVIRTVPDEVVEHHMMHCALENHFELHEFPNDLARWCWTALGDNVLGEQLGLIDPYQQACPLALRASLAGVIEERLWSLERPPWCRPGLELHLIASRLIAYDTGERVSTPSALLEAIERMSLRSLYYHVHEARRRTAGQTDDFSLWLETSGTAPSLVTMLREIDFYFLNLNQLRQALVEAFRHYMEEAPPVSRTVA
jgi:hypothetical protein